MPPPPKYAFAQAFYYQLSSYSKFYRNISEYNEYGTKIAEGGKVKPQLISKLRFDNINLAVIIISVCKAVQS